MVDYKDGNVAEDGDVVGFFKRHWMSLVGVVVAIAVIVFYAVH